MGFISGVTRMAGSVLSVGSSIVHTVTSLGKGAFSLVGGIAKSLPGKIMLGAGAGLAITNVVNNASKSGSKSGFGAFAGSLKSTVENVVGGAASLIKNAFGGLGSWLSGKSDKSAPKDDPEAGKLDKAIANIENGSMTQTAAAGTQDAETGREQQEGPEGPEM